MTHMHQTSFSPVKILNSNYYLTGDLASDKIRDFYFTFCLTDVDTGEIYYHARRKATMFAAGKLGEQMLCDIFACFVRGLKKHPNLSLSITSEIEIDSLPITFL